ncbi:hypothetical protein [Micromonospora sp. 4G55]|uniref:hypothetical protein n=1 Tax=Micromonospora sp. 4G55 TaxID=2806102 RepID=UPI001A3667EE|nr:hypothetical protein [Micromonospora sp. 4G55]MBM0257268.1 hypothetical protein [Micromonospora sp. 4G55]
MTAPRSGDLLYVTRSASVQFINPIFFRVIRVLGWRTYDGWLWLEGYQLNIKGDATARRAIFVQQAGLRSGDIRTAGQAVTLAQGDSG